MHCQFDMLLLCESNTSDWVSIVVTIILAVLISILTHVVWPKCKRETIAKHISMTKDLLHNGRPRFIIHNKSDYTIENAVLYISFDNVTRENLILCTHCPYGGPCMARQRNSNHRYLGDCSIARHNFMPIENVRLCWLLATPQVVNPYRIDICAGEKQDFAPFRITDNNVHVRQVEVVSEAGWSAGRRAILKPGVYTGRIDIVSSSTVMLSFSFALDTNDLENIEIRPMNNLGFWRLRWKKGIDLFWKLIEGIKKVLR